MRSLRKHVGDCADIGRAVRVICNDEDKRHEGASYLERMDTDPDSASREGGPLAVAIQFGFDRVSRSSDDIIVHGLSMSTKIG